MNASPYEENTQKSLFILKETKHVNMFIDQIMKISLGYSGFTRISLMIMRLLLETKRDLQHKALLNIEKDDYVEDSQNATTYVNNIERISMKDNENLTIV